MTNAGEKLCPAPDTVISKGEVRKKPETGKAVSIPARRILYDEETEKKVRRRHIRAGRLIVGAVLFGGWELLVRAGLLDSYYWSCPSAILKTTWQQLTTGTLWGDILYTSGATILGFLTGTFFGALLGLSFWWSKSYAGISEPYLIILNALPKLALGPVLVILFGIGFPSKVILAFLMTVITTALYAYSGVKSVDPAMETLMYSLGAKRRQVFAKVVVPWSLPWIISSLRVNIALALAGAIVGEFIASEHGVGRMVIYAGTILDINLVWVGVFVLSILSMVMYGGVVLLEKFLSKHLSNIHS
ncbi:MAG: ABC transporter permease [Oscillospiraceae bacterium]|jgi:NitT/TauT family transport system permease protein|nr:ABC transporter permease [Oscillospiraceae bacterium]